MYARDCVAQVMTRERASGEAMPIDDQRAVQAEHSAAVSRKAAALRSAFANAKGLITAVECLCERESVRAVDMNECARVCMQSEAVMVATLNHWCRVLERCKCSWDYLERLIEQQLIASIGKVRRFE